jgi:hypothetical protein
MEKLRKKSCERKAAKEKRRRERNRTLQRNINKKVSTSGQMNKND